MHKLYKYENGSLQIIYSIDDIFETGKKFWESIQHYYEDFNNA
jgi:hypothetical protein